MVVIAIVRQSQCANNLRNIRVAVVNLTYRNANLTSMNKIARTGALVAHVFVKCDQGSRVQAVLRPLTKDMAGYGTNFLSMIQYRKAVRYVYQARRL